MMTDDLTRVLLFQVSALQEKLREQQNGNGGEREAELQQVRSLILLLSHRHDLLE